MTLTKYAAIQLLKFAVSTSKSPERCLIRSLKNDCRTEFGLSKSAHLETQCSFLELRISGSKYLYRSVRIVIEKKGC